MSANSQITPWAWMKAMEEQFKKSDHLSRYHPARRPKAEPGVIYAEPVRPCNPFLTYYNNGKQNCCNKTRYDYNFFFCEGYDQDRHRDDRKHAWFYQNRDLEEQYPCRTVPLLTSGNYGHRPPYDDSCRRPKINAVKVFKRNNGVAYCVSTNANGYAYDSVRHNPSKPFMWNAQYGYTYSPIRNN